MSLFRQLWLAIIGLTLFGFIGSLLVSVFTARNYLEQQLYMKNLDNAAALALVLTQMPEKDPVLVELMVSSQFDTGHYQEIQLLDPKHRLIVSRQYTGQDLGAPAWFVRLFPIRAAAGIAQVQDGWRQFGTLRVVSHSRFAYRELWHGTLELLAWFLAGGVAAGVLGTLLLQLILRPLGQVVEQARAIGERRFITVGEPRAPELKSVVQAMNDMVGRIKGMFAEEAERLEGLRRAANHDAVTHLANRGLFMNRLGEALTSEEAAPRGALLILRLADLDEINLRLGHEQADRLLQDVARVLQEVCSRQHDGLAARIKGGDFALLAAGADSAGPLARELADALNEQVAAKWAELEGLFHIGAVLYHRGENTSELLALADQALAAAEAEGPNRWHAIEKEPEHPLAHSGESWRKLLTDAITEGRLMLARFPVRDAGGQLLHQESAARLQTEPDGPWLVAGDFVPMALRLKLTPQLDLEIVRLALAELGTDEGDIAVNLSAEAIADCGFRDTVSKELGAHPELARRLWVEVPEYGVFRLFEPFRVFSTTLKSFGCRIGIEHFGHHFGEVPRLADLGLDYLKVDASFVRGLDQNPGNQEFLGGLCKMAHAVGIQVIAEGVQTAAELEVLSKIGFDGATGPAVSNWGA